MTKDDVADALDEIGTLLELKGENAFRCNAYHNAARAIEQSEEDLAQLLAAGRLGEIRGIGETLQEKIATLLTTGELATRLQVSPRTIRRRRKAGELTPALQLGKRVLRWRPDTAVSR